ncbi:MAG: hypothetical protein IPQ03_17695 [Bacteroidetes bacterium]|nr:hypothetical protein [Bacteroidota bacterium]
MFISRRKIELEIKQDRIKNELTAKADKLQNDARIIRKVPEYVGYATSTDGRTVDGPSTKLMEKKDLYSGQLEDEKSKSSEELYSKVSTFIRYVECRQQI